MPEKQCLKSSLGLETGFCRPGGTYPLSHPGWLYALVFLGVPAMAAAQGGIPVSPSDQGAFPDLRTALIPMWTSLVAAWVALAVAIYNAYRTARLEHEKQDAARQLQDDKAAADQRLKVLENALAIGKAREDARTRYEWDARQRLLEQVEPVLFLTGEVMEQALGRLHNLARSARSGLLGPAPETWLPGSGPEDFAITTAFRLLRPAACLRLLEEKITSADFSLDQQIQLFFVLSKLYRELLVSPFALCSQEPKIIYNFAHRTPGEPDYAARDLPQRRIQHLYNEQMDDVCDALTTSGANHQLALKRYGDFRAELSDPASATSQRFEPALFLLRGVSPQMRPVQWRVGLACAVVSKVMLDMLASRNAVRGHKTMALEGRFEDAAQGPWTEALVWTQAAEGPSLLQTELHTCVIYLRTRLENPVAHIRLSGLS